MTWNKSSFAQVVQKCDSFIHWMNHYVQKMNQFDFTVLINLIAIYPVDSAIINNLGLVVRGGIELGVTPFQVWCQNHLLMPPPTKAPAVAITTTARTTLMTLQTRLRDVLPEFEHHLQSQYSPLLLGQQTPHG